MLASDDSDDFSSFPFTDPLRLEDVGHFYVADSTEKMIKFILK